MREIKRFNVKDMTFSPQPTRRSTRPEQQNKKKKKKNPHHHVHELLQVYALQPKRSREAALYGRTANTSSAATLVPWSPPRHHLHRFFPPSDERADKIRQASSSVTVRHAASTLQGSGI